MKVRDKNIYSHSKDILKISKLIAVNNFIHGLESGIEDFYKFKDVIESKPLLI